MDHGECRYNSSEEGCTTVVGLEKRRGVILKGQDIGISELRERYYSSIIFVRNDRIV